MQRKYKVIASIFLLVGSVAAYAAYDFKQTPCHSVMFRVRGQLRDYTVTDWSTCERNISQSQGLSAVGYNTTMAGLAIEQRALLDSIKMKTYLASIVSAFFFLAAFVLVTVLRWNEEGQTTDPRSQQS